MRYLSPLPDVSTYTVVTATAEDVPAPATPATGTPFSIANLPPGSAPPSKSPCLMLVQGLWTCPEGFDAPGVTP